MSVNSKMTAIANAIRAKTGGTSALTLDQMATEIAGIQTGSAPILTDITITENGEYTPGEGVDGFGKVTVEVEGGGGDYTNEQMVALIERKYSGDFIIPDGTTAIGNYALANMPSLTTSELPESVTKLASNAFRSSGVTIKRIPDATKKLDQYCFCYCDGLTEISIPEGVSISNTAFFQCTNLKTVTFRGKASSIHQSGFGQCDGIATINVPWAEGAVDGAPWGATNATINYNYVEG